MSKLNIGLATPLHPGSVPNTPPTGDYVLHSEDGVPAWREASDEGGGEDGTGGTGASQRVVSLTEVLAVPGDSGSHTVLTLEDVPAGASVYAFARVDLADFGDAPGNISIAISTPAGTGGNGGGGQLVIDGPTYSTSVYVFDRMNEAGSVLLLVNAGTIGAGGGGRARVARRGRRHVDGYSSSSSSKGGSAASRTMVTASRTGCTGEPKQAEKRVRSGTDGGAPPGRS